MTDKLSQEIVARTNRELLALLEEKKARLVRVQEELDTPASKRVFGLMGEKQSLEREIGSLARQADRISEAVSEVLNPRPRVKESRSSCTA